MNIRDILLDTHHQAQQIEQRDMRHLKKQRIAQADFASTLANAIGRVSSRDPDKAPPTSAIKARRKAQRRARAIARRNR